MHTLQGRVEVVQFHALLGSNILTQGLGRNSLFVG